MKHAGTGNTFLLFSGLSPLSEPLGWTQRKEVSKEKKVT
jgi:hypothetical protein